MILKIIYSAILITILTACDTNVPVVSKADGTNLHRHKSLRKL
jgi:hypothetical protein